MSSPGLMGLRPWPRSWGGRLGVGLFVMGAILLGDGDGWLPAHIKPSSAMLQLAPPAVMMWSSSLWGATVYAGASMLWAAFMLPPPFQALR